jgi:hypothetical protein
MSPRCAPRRPYSRGAALGVALCIAAVSAACGSSDDGSEPACLAAAPSLDCKAAYGLVNGQIAPTFDDVWTRTLLPTCGISGCHAGPNPQNGLALDVEDTAYTDLMGASSTGEPRVTPGNASCGKFMVRLETAGQSWSMPPGNHLDDATLCSIRHWVANGAKR